MLVGWEWLSCAGGPRLLLDELDPNRPGGVLGGRSKRAHRVEPAATGGHSVNGKRRAPACPCWCSSTAAVLDDRWAHLEEPRCPDESYRVNDRDADVLPDKNLLTEFTTEDQHLATLLRAKPWLTRLLILRYKPAPRWLRGDIFPPRGTPCAVAQPLPWPHSADPDNGHDP